jgi:hypothetical protein
MPWTISIEYYAKSWWIVYSRYYNPQLQMMDYHVRAWNVHQWRKESGM